LYVSFPDEAGQRVRQLRAFEKIYLEGGETGVVSLSIRHRDLSYWDVIAQKWAIAKGEYTFWAGASSRDLRGSMTYIII
jgi:beta-glucosidase